MLLSCQMLNLNLRRGAGEERVGKRGCPLLGLAVVTGVLPVQSGCPGRGGSRQRERERKKLAPLIVHACVSL